MGGAKTTHLLRLLVLSVTALPLAVVARPSSKQAAAAKARQAERRAARALHLRKARAAGAEQRRGARSPFPDRAVYVRSARLSSERHADVYFKIC